MKALRGFVLGLVVLMAAVVSRAETVTLQQGLSGYGGCQDSFITWKYRYELDCNPACAFGLHPELMLNSERYGG